MIQSIHFREKKWQFNKNAGRNDLKTDCNLITNPLRKDGKGAAEGLAFIWILTISASGIEILYYSTEEFFLIPNRKITDAELMVIIKQSYDHSYMALAPKNLAVGFDAGFPSFDQIPIDLLEIRQVLDM